MYLPEFGWYRIDARGNKPGVNAEFCPPAEKLAWSSQSQGEMSLPDIWTDPLPEVVHCLKHNWGWQEVQANLPDFDGNL
ncbi:MAG: hypothetical protein HQ515_05045 [Phycisphaeraceae bacterium]|nr:hypothetical protein [Phycisphaeraceae bacterium]